MSKWENIPEELKQNGLWCNWKLTEKGKIPYNSSTGNLAKVMTARLFTHIP